MSIAAVSWATRDVPNDLTPGQRLVLIYLAESAGGNGSDWIGAWPSAQTIATAYGMTRRTVLRHLQVLEGRGLIRRGDQRMVSHYRPDRRPVVWDLVPDATNRTGCQNVTPSLERGDTTDRTGCHGGPNGVTPRTERGDRHVTQTVLKPSMEPSMEPTPYSPPASEPTGSGYPDAFEDWYATYPVHKDKTAALKAWRKVVAKIGETNLMQALVDRLPQIHAAAPYIKNPATWLNKGGWQDDIETPTVKMSQNDQRQQAIIDAANQLFSEEVNHDRPAIG